MSTPLRHASRTACAAALLAALGTQAQQPQPPVEPLSQAPTPVGITPAALPIPQSLLAVGQPRALRELFEQARASDAAFLQLRAQAEASGYAADQAGALRLPQIGLQANAQRQESRTPGAAVRSASVTTYSAGLAATQTLFNGTHGPTIGQAERGRLLARLQFEAGEADLVVRLAQAYFDVLAARDALATVQSARASITEQLAAAKRAFEVGTATITDTREAQARFDLNTAQELAAQNEWRVKQLALENIVGQAGVAPRSLALPVAFPVVAPASPDAWATQAEQSNANIQQAKLGVEVAELETEKARAGHLPTVTLTGNLGQNRSNTSGDALTATGIIAPYASSGRGTTASVGVSLNMPLFAGFAVQNRVSETLALETKAREQLNGARVAVNQAARQLYFAVQTGTAQVRALEAAEQSSLLALKATQLGYEVGVRVSMDVLNAQAQVSQTQRDLAQARYGVLMNYLRLKQVAGTLTPEDLRTIDALLVAG